MPAAATGSAASALAHGWSTLDHRADARLVHHAADAALLPGRVAARRRARRADLARALRPHLRVPRPAGRHRRAAGAARLAEPGDVAFDDVWFRYDADGPWTLEDVTFTVPTRHDDRARRRDRVRQDDARLPDRPPLRRRARQRLDRRRRRARPLVRDARQTWSASSRRRRICSTRASARTCGSRSPTRPTTRSKPRPRPRRSTT